MPAQVSVDNDFSKGLITQATGLNFPKGACTETYNCEFDFVGGVRRRDGFDFEKGFSTKDINRTNQAVSTYLWKNVAGNGDITVLVQQVGATLYFYETANTGNYSNGAVSDTVVLTAVSGATSSDISVIEVQYSDGNGLLFVTHPYIDPIYISYDNTTHTATDTAVTLQIRDFLGATADPYTISERPTATLAGLNVNHKYNLYNQGWTTTNLTDWDTAQTTMPSNADVMWQFFTSDPTTFDKSFSSTTGDIDRAVLGNTPAPKGHFILTLSNQDRDTAAGTSGVAATSLGVNRPTTSAFFAGRVFYSGINSSGVNTNIYFTQIIETPNQYGYCYQANDPTSADNFDLLPSDGGVISIHDAGTIIKLVAIPGGLCVFAHRGIWFVTGSSAIGFTANDYTIQKISTVETLSATSFVNTQSYSSTTNSSGGSKQNYIAWWNGEGIYNMSITMNFSGIQSVPAVESLTDTTIRDFYSTIPLISKRFARGVYHPLDGHVRWIFKSEATNEVTNIYEFDRVLSYNTITGAFYPWTISDSTVKVNSIIATDLLAKAIEIDTVVDGADTVVDEDGNTVIAFGNAGLQDPNFDKYLVSYQLGATYKFTFADKTDANFRDWFTFDGTGVDYTSYLIGGYKISGDAIRKFQNTWVRIYSDIIESISYYFQSIWDYAITGSSTGQWSTKQYVHKDDTTHTVFSKRLKVRGHGLILQFRIESVPGEPFKIIGWSLLQTSNTGP